MYIHAKEKGEDTNDNGAHVVGVQGIGWLEPQMLARQDFDWDEPFLVVGGNSKLADRLCTMPRKGLLLSVGIDVENENPSAWTQNTVDMAALSAIGRDDGAR